MFIGAPDSYGRSNLSTASIARSTDLIMAAAVQRAERIGPKLDKPTADIGKVKKMSRLEPFGSG